MTGVVEGLPVGREQFGDTVGGPESPPHPPIRSAPGRVFADDGNTYNHIDPAGGFAGENSELAGVVSNAMLDSAGEEVVA